MTRKATLMLADHAIAENGKLYINGGGWTIAGFCPHAIAILLEVPWDQANDPQTIRFELLDSDGEAFIVPGPAGPVPVELSVPPFETGRPPGTPKGAPITWAGAFNIGPLPYEPNTRYVWQMTWNDENDDAWRLPFNTPRNMQPPGAQQVA